MRRILTAILFAAAISSADSQTPNPGADREQLLALVKEIQTQQSQIAANQAKIDAKLAEVAETVRVARIFSSRSR